jgi:hypothetical protein
MQPVLAEPKWAGKLTEADRRAVPAAVMFTLAAGKARTGTALGNPVLQTEGRVTLIDGLLAARYVMHTTTTDD